MNTSTGTASESSTSGLNELPPYSEGQIASTGAAIAPNAPIAPGPTLIISQPTQNVQQAPAAPIPQNGTPRQLANAGVNLWQLMHLKEQALGAQVRQLRKAKGWTQQQLAEQACIGRSTVCHAEKGYSGMRVYIRLALALGLNLAIT